MATTEKTAHGGPFAVIQTGGKQYKVKQGDVLKIEKLPEAKEGKVTFEQVLLVDDGMTTKIGAPYLAGAKVEANVLGEGRHKKVMVVKYRAKSRYYKKNGHRQPFTEVEIASLS